MPLRRTSAAFRRLSHLNHHPGSTGQSRWLELGGQTNGPRAPVPQAVVSFLGRSGEPGHGIGKDRETEPAVALRAPRETAPAAPPMVRQTPQAGLALPTVEPLVVFRSATSARATPLAAAVRAMRLCQQPAGQGCLREQDCTSANCANSVCACSASKQKYNESGMLVWVSGTCASDADCCNGVACVIADRTVLQHRGRRLPDRWGLLQWGLRERQLRLCTDWLRGRDLPADVGLLRWDVLARASRGWRLLPEEGRVRTAIMATNAPTPIAGTGRAGHAPSRPSPLAPARRPRIVARD